MLRKGVPREGLASSRGLQGGLSRCHAGLQQAAAQGKYPGWPVPWVPSPLCPLLARDQCPIPDLGVPGMVALLLIVAHLLPVRSPLENGGTVPTSSHHPGRDDALNTGTKLGTQHVSAPVVWKGPGVHFLPTTNFNEREAFWGGGGGGVQPAANMSGPTGLFQGLALLLRTPPSSQQTESGPLDSLVQEISHPHFFLVSSESLTYCRSKTLPGASLPGETGGASQKRSREGEGEGGCPGGVVALVGVGTRGRTWNGGA